MIAPGTEYAITAAIKNGHSNNIDSKPPCSPQMRQPQGMAPITPATGSTGYLPGLMAGVIFYVLNGR
jgi:hypothetical protein